MRAQRPKVAIECGKQVSQENLQGELLLTSKQSSFIGTAQEVTCLIEGAAGDSDEALVIKGRGPAVALGDVGSYAVRRTDDLVTDGGAGEGIPVGCSLPDEVCQLLGHGI